VNPRPPAGGGKAAGAQPGGQSASPDELARLDAKLDAALDETFPASDPIAVGRPTGSEPMRRHPRAPAAAARQPGSRRPARGAKVQSS